MHETDNELKDDLIEFINEHPIKYEVYKLFGYGDNPHSRSIKIVKNEVLKITGYDLDTLVSIAI